MAAKAKTQEEENEELRRFREQWRAEVRSRKQDRMAEDSAPGAGGEPATKSSAEPRPLRNVLAPSLQGTTPLGYVPIRARADSKVQNAGLHVKRVREDTQFTPNQRTAIEIYDRAVRAEEASDLDTALQLYREAFRKYDNVDGLWRVAQAQSARTNPARPPAGPSVEEVAQQTEALKLSEPVPAPVIVDVHVPTLAESRHHAMVQQAAHTATVSGLLEKIILGFPPGLKFELVKRPGAEGAEETKDTEETAVPEDTSISIRSLPDEIVIQILRKLSPLAVERFAAACRKARVLTLDSAIWRTLVEDTYQVPQITAEDSIDTILELYKTVDYRRVYVEHPRVRLDGVYIAVCHYVRTGMHENPWVNMSHLITYNRYLRFFPNGQVISMLANESDDPQRLIMQLKLSSRLKGLSIGTWQLVRPPPEEPGGRSVPLVYVDNLADTSGTVAHSARYMFQMTLALRARPLGRWNKLDFVRYASVNLGSGATADFPLTNERPFWFSKVRSYGSGLHMPELDVQ